MGRAEKKPDPIKEEGAPEWMVTFSDCMTLLLTFFVLLLSFSSFDEVGKLQQLGSVFASQFSIDLKTTREKDAVFPSVAVTEELQKGSEKPVLDADGRDRSKKETLSMDHRNRKIFLLSSGKIFWGKGTTLSPSGKKILFDMASFLKDMPNRIVVSENGQKTESRDEALGLQRAWAVIDYLSTEGALDKNRISLSAAGTVAKGENAGREQGLSAKTDRTLEIVLLEGSICN